ncbi:MAG: hypothetical protein AAGJ34_08330 [Pseudomonadota bacterium]
MSDQETVLFAPISAGRYWFGIACLSLPALFIVFALSQGVVTRLWAMGFLMAIASAFLWAAYRMYSVPRAGLLFDGRVLRTEDGLVVAALTDIDVVQTGIFAMRPSNGFSLIMKEADHLPTRPGIFWRQGKMIGIGGILAAAETRAIGRLMQAKLKETRAY